MASIKQISERISYKQHEGFSTVVISPRLDDRKQLLLTFWVFAWTFSGLLFIAQLFLDYPVEMKRMIVAFLVFWLYYEYR
ncbi:MAG TPA: hypothetical protein PK637_06660, partial [Flavobacteriales bacterium]|nr:hypothetical protein [Flavobacteriales bacterium]